MNTTLKCERCGAPTLGPDPLGGLGNLCPRCVLGFAMDEPTLPLAAAAPGLKQGATLGNYEILDTLGRGGMGVVYRARHIGLDREVALKVLTPANAGDAEFVERFRREAKTLAALSHPNIVQIHDSGFIGDVAYLAMEFVDGVNLRQLIAEKRLPPEEALLIVPQLCDALEYAHSTGIVHRDIKPENILVDKMGRVKIADFGLAKIVRGAASHHGLTNTNVTMGTPHYMAPEQVENTSTVDHRADIFSMGVVFYEMLTGELPIGRFGLPSRRPGVNSRLDQIVLKALENKPADRYQRASHVKDAISRIGSPGAIGVRHSHPDSFRRRTREEINRLPLSKMAMGGFLLSLSTVVLPIIGASNAIPGGIGCFLVLVTYIPALILSICGTVAASTSRGGRRGLSYGISGIVITTLMVFIGPLLFFASVNSARAAAEGMARTREMAQEAISRMPMAPTPMMQKCMNLPGGFTYDFPPRWSTQVDVIRRFYISADQDPDLYRDALEQVPQVYMSLANLQGFFRGTLREGMFEVLGFEIPGGYRIVVLPKSPHHEAVELRILKEHFARTVDR